jgi:Glycosyl hydrolases family 38 N-terminal domain/Glycosyl hydrolases family 38 C-terminal beta sandwich domain
MSVQLVKRRTILRLLATSLAPAALVRAALSAAGVRRALAGKTLRIVPYSHIDFAWVHTAQWQGDRAAQVLGMALDLLKRNPDYRFFVDTWNEFVERFLTRLPERAGEFRAAVERGHMAICGGTVANQHPSWMETESLIRNMVLGRRLFRTVVPGFRPEVMVLYDVTPGPAQMPQILRKAGYSGFRTCRPDAAMTAAGVPRNFIWQGLDGTRIPVSRGPYGGLFSDTIAGFDADWDKAVTRFYESEVERAESPGDSALVWIPMGADDVLPLHTPLLARGNPERPIPVLNFVRQWRRREQTPLAFATPVEYFRELAKIAPSLPTHHGVLEQTLWTFLYGLNGNCGLRLWRTRADRALVDAEAASACCAAAFDAPYPESRFDELWHDLLRASSHAQMWLFAADYDAQLGAVKRAVDGAGRIRDRALQQVAGRVRRRRAAASVLLWNPLPWERTEVAQLWVSFQDVSHSNFLVRDTDGNLVPFEVVDLNYANRATPRGGGGAIKEANILVKCAVPALGYTTLYFEPAEGEAEVPRETSAASLDAGFANLAFSPRGIESLSDAANGSVYPHAGGVLFNEVADSGLKLHYGPVTRTIEWADIAPARIVSGPLRRSFELEGPLGPHHVTIRGDLYPHAKRISFCTTIQCAGGSGHFMTTAGLPSGGALSADAHFGVEPRDVASIRYAGVERLLHNVFYGAHWVDYAHPRGGLTLIGTTGEKGYQLLADGRALGHFLLMAVPPASNWERFVTPASSGEGVHRFDYQILLHDGDWRRGEVPRRAMEAMHPLAAVYPDHMALPARRTLPDRQSFVHVEPRSVLVTAFYRQADAWYLRAYECEGAAADAAITVPLDIHHAEETDVHGAGRRRLGSFAGRTIRIALRPWEIVTLKII